MKDLITSLQEDLNLSKIAHKNPIKTVASLLLIYDDAREARDRGEKLDPIIVLKEIETALSLPTSFLSDS